MYYPPLFTSVRPFDPRTNPLGGHLDVPVVGTGRENPLDLSVKTVRQTPDSTAEADDLLMLDHRKLASLAASHSLSAMGRQLTPASSLLDPALFRLAYGGDSNACSHAAMIPGLAPPFCYDRATGVAVPTSLASHQLMSTFLQQQQQQQHQAVQRERCLEQQQALYARTTAQQAAAAAAYIDQATLPLHLRGGIPQRDAASAAAALAASRGLYAPALPTPMVLPAFSLYTEDKGAFTSLRNSNSDKAYLNGTSNALEAARFAEHLQRIREQQLQQAAKCNSACCTSSPLSGLSQQTVPCACCLQSPSQSALCARSPMGCLKDPTTASTGKMCNGTCDYLQPSLTFLHRPTAATATPADLRLAVPGYCGSLTSSDVGSNNQRSDDHHPLFQASSLWNSGLPTVPAGKTAFTVPKKKEPKELSHSKESNSSKTPISSKESDKEPNVLQDNRRDSSKCGVKVENIKKDDKEVIVISEEVITHRSHEKNLPAKISGLPKTAHSHGAITTMTTATTTVPTKCEGGTIPVVKMPPLLEAVRPTDIIATEASVDIPTTVPSPQGPPPLIAVANGASTGCVGVGKIPLTTSEVTHAHPIAIYTNANSAALNAISYKSQSDKSHSSSESSKSGIRSPKKVQPVTKVNGLNCIKEENIRHHSHHPSVLPLPKPIPHIPSPHHLPSAHYASHYHHAHHLPPNQSAPTPWAPPAQHPVPVPSTAQQAPPPPPPPVVTTTPSHPNHHQELPTVIKREPDYGDSANVLQSLLVRPNSDPRVPSSLLTTPTTDATTLGVDYHHLHHMAAVHQHVDAASRINPIAERHEDTESSCDPLVKTARKRPATEVNGSTNADGIAAEKKRTTATEFTPPEYAFQRSSHPYEAPETAQCPYTFVPETSDFHNQVIDVKEEKPLDATCPEKLNGLQTVAVVHQETNAPDFLGLSKTLHTEDSYNEQLQKNVDRMAAVKAKRKLRKRLLARLFQKKKMIGNSGTEKTSSREIALQHTRRLLSQLTLSWRHRRFLYKCNAVQRKKIRPGLDLVAGHRKRKSTLVYKIRRDDLLTEMKQAASETDDSVSKATSDQPGGLSMPSEMKRLMVNKALGETILHRAARLGYPEVVAYCLETNCGNVNARDNAGYTPLHECCSRGHLDIARALLQYGADINASAAGGIRPLHDAVENDHVEIVRLLLSYGADPSIATYSGLTPLKLARSALMAEFLQSFLADISGEVEGRPLLPWRFWGSASCLDPEDSGYDVFDSVPSDPEGEGEGEDDFLFEVSDSPHLPTFRLPLPAAGSKAPYNYLRLSDVLRKTALTKEIFLAAYSHIDVITISKHEFEASATCSQLLTGTKLDSVLAMRSHDRLLDAGNTIDIVRLDNGIREVLGIETISVR